MQAQTASPRFLRVFLCHASEDKPVVEPLNKRLKKCNIDSWLDKDKLLGGQDWQYQIRRAVRDADVVLVCLSNKSVNKVGFVHREIKLALEVADEQPEGSIFIIPLRLEACSVPDRLGHLQRIDFFEKDGFASLLRTLEFKRQSLNVAVAPISYKASRKLTSTRPNTPIVSNPPSGPATSRSGMNRLVAIVATLVFIGIIIAALVMSHVFHLFSGPATSNVLYQARFSQDNQGWLSGTHAQWRYNDTDKVLESDGTMPCCTPTTQLEQVVLNAPATFTRPDYTIEAQIKTLGNNPYRKDQPPFFGIFFRGYGLNGTGYMAGIIASKPDANTGPYSFILFQDPNKQIVTREDQSPYALDTQWHTYWVMIQGNTCTFFIDQKQLYFASLPQYGTSGPEIGIEDYGYLLRIQNLTVYPLCTPFKNCPQT